MLRTFKYRLWTNRNQDRELCIMLETHRRLYNACLEQRKSAYESEKRSIKYTEQSAWFKAAPHQRLLCQNQLQLCPATMRRLDKAFQAFFRRSSPGRTEKPRSTRRPWATLPVKTKVVSWRVPGGHLLLLARGERRGRTRTETGNCWRQMTSKIFQIGFLLIEVNRLNA